MENYNGLVITYDYGTAEESIDETHPIYVYRDEWDGVTYTENNITMTVEEAEWLSEKLHLFITNLKKVRLGR